jgi:site-specific DNA recombinase
VAKVTADPRAITIELCLGALCDALGIKPASDTQGTIVLTSPVRLTRTGRTIQLVQRNGRAVTSGTPDPGVFELLRKGRGWWLKLQSGTIDIATIAREEQINDSWVSRLVRLNFLAPALVESILAGTQPASRSASLINGTFSRHSVLPKWPIEKKPPVAAILAFSCSPQTGP